MGIESPNQSNESAGESPALETESFIPEPELVTEPVIIPDAASTAEALSGVKGRLGIEPKPVFEETPYQNSDGTYKPMTPDNLDAFVTWEVICRICGQKGHPSDECPNRNRQQ